MPELSSLTTDFAPSDRELYTDYQWRTYSFELMQANKVANCLSELICQRLSHNFQVYAGDNEETVVLICGPVVHALAVKAQHIDVTNWEFRLEEGEKIPYASLLWNSFTNQCTVIPGVISNSTDPSVAWNHLDTVICEDDEVTREFIDCIHLVSNVG